jgi:hypothetical protein
MIGRSNYIGMLLALVAPLALGGEPQSGHAPALAGHYYLKGGPSEVGSELLLKDSGQFAWVLMYGAADYVAKGTWKLTGKRLVLSSTPSPAPVGAVQRALFTSLTLRVEPSGLVIDDQANGLRGTYAKN